MTELEGLLLSADTEFKRDLPLSSLSTFRIGGTADYAVFPDSADKLIRAIRALRTCGVSFEVVGNSSNILFSDDGYRGAVISTRKIANARIEGDRLICGCGAMLPAISRLAADNSLSGLEFACGIPATLGGAVVMNAGAHGSEISRMIVRCAAYDTEGDRVIELTAEECGFSYRHSIFSENPALVCLEAEFELRIDREHAIKERMKEYSEKRRGSQPLDKPNAGSFFKRPEGYFAAKLIDECDLKGYRVGGACVSEKHAGFIVNLGGATCADVLAVAEHVSKTVFEATGIKLEREVRVILSPEK